MHSNGKPAGNIPGNQSGGRSSHRSCSETEARGHEMNERDTAESSGAPDLRQLLMKRSQWFEERVVEAANTYGYGFVTPAMNRLFAHMPRNPVSISELARRLAVSRQAVHQTVGEARRRGILELVADESDGRVRKVRFTEEGEAMKRSATLAVRNIEAELERRLGSEDFAGLRRILQRHW
jgi:DNA-binding MarR family transcriptional regulator